MNFVLPIIVSDKVGCGPDMVKEGENGYIIRSPEKLADALREIVSDGEKRREFGKRSAELVSIWNVEQAVRGAYAALRSIYESV